MSCAYFVSDIHLRGGNDDSKYEAFLTFLRALRLGSDASLHRPTHLFLVGDIFDLWVGSHEYFRNKFSAAIAEIQELVRDGVEVHFFEGNHDFHLSEFWQKRLGVSVHSGVAYFNIAQKIVRVEHGDLINLDDKSYLRLRWFLRTPVMRYLALNLPARLIQSIGETASRTSRNFNERSRSNTDVQVRAMIRQHAERAFKDQPFDLLITGHVHIVDDITIQTPFQTNSVARSVNLGSWFDGPRAFILTDERADLVYF